MSEAMVLGIDQGGSGSRAVLLDHEGVVRGYGYRPVARIYPQPSWVEQRPAVVARSVAEAIGDALARARCSPADVVACGLTSQRDTTFAWDRRNGRPLGNAITWQDLRTVPLVEEVDQWQDASERRQRLGQFPGSYSAAMHMAWRMRHDPSFRRAAERQWLRVSLAAGWLIQALGQPFEHALDYSLLQAMTVFDPRRRQLWDEWITYLDLPRAALPVARPTLYPFGELHIAGHAIPVTAMLADQQAGLFGYDCRQPGEAVVTHGTASFVNVVAGALAPPQGICKTYLAWELDAIPTYTLEADMTVTGAAIRWLSQMRLIRHAHELDQLAGSVADSDGVVFVPAFTGLGVPWEDRQVRGTLMGMTLGTTPGHLARALFEAIGCQLHAIIATMEQEAKLTIQVLRVGGGLANSDRACQIQADLAGLKLVRARNTETGVRAAALLGGLGAGFWATPDALPPLPLDDAQVFEPTMSASARENLLQRWYAAVQRLREG
ncbi:FGGY family carbohydrate kinase [Candidatus Chloroploca sp. Khr17]|uniref:FGGY family carbohydrate kinase n=1 Tax=Candidatus Chloroploca sp. Khr17 TaxID=2496869 RepID=UPI00101C05E8|nr:FGGY family carbohydrate kinase [Candidatus Chloroploca sp. Khr17]